MTKKRSKKTPSKLQENTIVEEQNPSSTPKKSSSEMDEIFAGKKRKKSAVEKAEKLDEVSNRTDGKKKNTIGEEQNPSSTPKKLGGEMDEIFAGEKRKKSAVEKAEKLDEVSNRTDGKKKNTIGEEQNPSSAPKKLGSEIDEIFAGIKRKKSEVKKKKAKPDEVTKKTDRKKTNDRKKIKGRDDGEFVDQPSRPKKRTVDGLTLYTEEELGLTKGDAGGTPLCPFDCSCCF